MWVVAYTLLALVSCGLSAPLSVCPESCLCQSLGDRQEAFCSSLDFLSKPLSPKLEWSLVKLTLQDKSITSIDTRLKKLRSLKHLNLSSNRIKYFTAAQVPKSVETLDLSNNAISYIPTDWNSLPALKRLNLSGNPLACNCDALWLRDFILSTRRIVVEEPVACASPKTERGNSWLKVQCNSEYMLGEMQGDEPDDIPGSGDLGEPLITESPRKIEDAGPIEEEFIKDNINAVHSSLPSTELPQDVWGEIGSGDDDFTFDNVSEAATEGHREVPTATPSVDEDYDEEEDTSEEPTTLIPEEASPEVPLDRGLPAGCIINCSTPAPLDTNDTESSSSPGFLEGFHIIIGDIFGTSSSTQNPEVPTTSPEPQTEAPVTTKKGEVTEAIEKEVKTAVVHETGAIQPKESAKEEIESIHETESTKEKENAVQAQESKQSSSTFIFLGVLLLVMICLIIYAVVRRTAAKKKNRHRSDVAGLDEKPAEEMKLIKPPTVENGKQNGKPETIPLINSQNGTKNHVEDDVEKDKPQRKEPVTPPGTPADDDDVELRQKPNDSLLTPETKRVTIRASEIPDSVPKTPILVTRHIDSDGKIVTTPNLSQRSAK